MADVFAAVISIFPSFVARDNVQRMPGIGDVTRALNSVYVKRMGTGAKESKKAIFEAIQNRQQEFMAGKTKNPFMIYPEGSTSNGEYIMRFKRGAF